MFFCSAPCDTDNGASGILIPVGSAKSDKSGNHVNSSGIRNFSGVMFGECGVINQLKAIPQPLNRGTSYEHASFQGIFDLVIGAPGDGGKKPVFGCYGLFAGVHKDETAGSIGVLNRSRLKAALAEQGRLLIPGDTGDGNFSAQEFRRGVPVFVAGRLCFRQHLNGDIHFFKDILVPFEIMNIK